MRDELEEPDPPRAQPSRGPPRGGNKPVRSTIRGAAFAHHGGGDTSPGPQRPGSRGQPGGAFAHHNQGGGNAGMGGTMKRKSGNMSIAEAVKVSTAALEVALQKTSGAGINEPDPDQVVAPVPLMVALDECPLQEVQGVVEMLLDHGALVNARDISGNTPLMYCVDRNVMGDEKKRWEGLKLELTHLLLDHGADPSKKNEESPPMSALDKSQLMDPRSPVAQAMTTVVRLRKLENSLPEWQPGCSPPKVPAKVLQELEACDDPSRCKSTAVMECYCKAAEVLRDNPDGLQLDFPENDKDFVPVALHKKTEPLRKALECADAILRKYGKLDDKLGILIFDGLLPLQVGIYDQYTERYSSTESKKALAQFVGSKNQRFLKGYNWAFNSLIEIPEASDLQAAVDLAESFPSGQGANKPIQIKESLREVMVDAVRAQRRVLLLAASVAEKAEATHLVVHKSGGGRAQPSSKRLFRSHEKVCLGTGPKGLLDVARGGIECPTMASVCKALKGLLDEAKAGKLQLLRIKMRFHLPSDGGWRDALVNFRFTDDESQHVCELQVMHKRMMTIRADMGAHKDYAQIRGAIEILELHGVNWLDEAGNMDEEDEGGRSPGAGSPSGRGNAEGGGQASGDVAKLQARVAELESELRERDHYIAELESQLQAATDGPQAAILSKFKRFDKDGDGSISRMELRAMMHTLDESLTDDEITAVFENIDKDGSGRVDYQEFVRWVCQVGSNDM